MQEKKQIPFRYPEKLEEDFKELFKFQGYTKKKNEALIDAVQITAELSRALDKIGEQESYFPYNKTKCYDLIRRLKEISKNPGKKDIKKLGLKK